MRVSKLLFKIRSIYHEVTSVATDNLNFIK